MRKSIAIAVLAGAVATGSGQPVVAQNDVNPWLGAGGGALAGGLLGRLIAGKHHNSAAMLGGAALGGLGGLFATHAYDQNQQKKAVEEQQQQQATANQWSAQNAAFPAAPPGGYSGINTAADVSEAQRLMTAIGIFNDPIDGIMGPDTRAAVIRYQADENLPQTGDVTPQLIESMKRTLGG